MMTIPLQETPNQSLTVQLGSQSVSINVYQMAYGLFVDVYVNNALIVAGVIAENLNRIVRSLYLGFVGDLAFVDTQGASDPIYTGLGTRYQLVYLEESDLPAGEG